MKNATLKFIALSLGVLCANYIKAQGCSDAGFCTINSFKPNTTDSAKILNNQLKLGAFLGQADNSILVYGNYLEYNRQLNKSLGLDAKLTTLAQTGNVISAFGLSDVFFNLNYRATEKLKLTLGTKIPLTTANKSYNQLPLPMDYQASLGTFDLIFGIGYEIKKIQVVAAIQQPLTQNSNRFIAANYPANSELSNFQSTNQFIRSGDVLLRVSYPINASRKLKLTPSILPIYHLTNDKFTDQFNTVQEIKGSQGLTLNGNIYIDYEIHKKHLVQVNYGMPFIVRPSRPDGLTRSWIVNLEYRFKF
jgi:hypothetical protein